VDATCSPRRAASAALPDDAAEVQFLASPQTSLSTVKPAVWLGGHCQAGLLGPDEWYAYVGVEEDELVDTSAASGWGVPVRFALERQHSGLAPILAIVVLPPVLVYLVTCARLSARTRERRYAELRLLGMRRAQTARVAMAETAVIGAVGAASGLAAYQVVMPWLASSGLLGFTWDAGSAPAGIGTMAWIWLVAVVGCGLLGAAGLRRSLRDPLTAQRDPTERRPRWWASIPLVLGSGAVFYVLTLRTASPAVMGETMALLTVGAILLTCLGFLLAIRSVTVATGRIFDRERMPYAVRLAGRRLMSAPSPIVRALTGLAIIVLVGGIGSAVSYAVASPHTGNHHHVWIEGSAMTNPAQREAAYGLVDYPRWLVQRSEAAREVTDLDIELSVEENIRQWGINLISIECSDLAAVAVVSEGECSPETLYRGYHVDDHRVADLPPAGMVVDYQAEDGAIVEVEIPSPTLGLATVEPTFRAEPVLLWTGSLPLHGWTEARLDVLLPAGLDELQSFKTRVAQIQPLATVVGGDGDLVLLEMAQWQRGVLTFGVFLGFSLGIMSFLIAAIDRAVQRRRDVSLLVVLGMAPRQIRATQWLQLAAPLLVVLSCATVLAFLAGNAFILIDNLALPWYFGTMTDVVGLWAVAGVAIAVLGAMLAGHRLRAEDLRRE
jgi:hypothetical protein